MARSTSPHSASKGSKPPVTGCAVKTVAAHNSQLTASLPTTGADHNGVCYFYKLPPELRLPIYRRVLLADAISTAPGALSDDTVLLSNYDKQERDETSRKVSGISVIGHRECFEETASGCCGDCLTERFSAISAVEAFKLPALLCVSKPVHNEAMPVLMGGLEFFLPYAQFRKKPQGFLAQTNAGRAGSELSQDAQQGEKRPDDSERGPSDGDESETENSSDDASDAGSQSEDESEGFGIYGDDDDDDDGEAFGFDPERLLRRVEHGMHLSLRQSVRTLTIVVADAIGLHEANFDTAFDLALDVFPSLHTVRLLTDVAVFAQNVKALPLSSLVSLVEERGLMVVIEVTCHDVGSAGQYAAETYGDFMEGLRKDVHAAIDLYAKVQDGEDQQ